MEIRGKKIILRPIKMTDAPRFVKWLSDPEVNQFTTRKSVSLKEEKQWIRGHAKTRKTALHFAIDTLDGVHIGTIALFLDLRDKNAGRPAIPRPSRWPACGRPFARTGR